MPASNFNGKSPIPVGTSGGITHGGTTDMAGNVKEWVPECRRRESLHPGRRVERTAYTCSPTRMRSSPFARHPNYGFRCIKLDRPEDLSAALTAGIELHPATGET